MAMRSVSNTSANIFPSARSIELRARSSPETQSRHKQIMNRYAWRYFKRDY